MISFVDNCLFVHIPKVAGQSIELAFLQRANLTWQQRDAFLLKKNSNPKKGPPRLAHLTALEYCQLGYLDKASFEQLFSFAFVRNPWDRLVSEYVYRQYPFSFRDFIFKYFPSAVSDNYAKGFDGYRHVIPQHKFTHDENDNQLVDFIGRFEDIEKDFSKVSELIIGEPLVLPFKNKTKVTARHQWSSVINNILMSFKASHKVKKHYRDYYDDDTKQWVANYYAKDISLFNYEF